MKNCLLWVNKVYIQNILVPLNGTSKTIGKEIGASTEFPKLMTGALSPFFTSS